MGADHLKNESAFIRFLYGNRFMPYRYIMSVLSFFGFFMVYLMRNNLSVAVVTMAEEYDWDKPLQGTILGSFFYGYIVTQIPGGWFATKYGGKWVFGNGILVTTVLTFVTPLVASRTWLLITVRVLEGLGEGVTYPAMHALWARWAPPLERSKLVTIGYAGAYAGTVFALPISGVICHSDNPYLGWPVVFYLSSFCGIIWWLAWAIWAFDSPEDNPYMDPVERSYILDAIEHEKAGEDAAARRGTDSENDGETQPLLTSSTEDHEVRVVGSAERGGTPWMHIARSGPVWAIVVAHFCNNWGFYTLLTCMPQYFKDVLHYDIQSSGFLAAVPYVALTIVVLVVGRVADIERKQWGWSTAVVRKAHTTIAFFSSCGFLIATGFVNRQNRSMAVWFLTGALGLSGFGQSGFNVNHLDVAPKHAGVLLGLSNMVATIPGFVGPQLTDDITVHGTRLEWQTVFYISAGVYAFGAIVFMLLGSGKKQKWADLTSDSQPLPEDDENESDGGEKSPGMQGVINSVQRV